MEVMYRHVNLLIVNFLANDTSVMICCKSVTRMKRNLVVWAEIFNVFLEIIHELSILQKFWREGARRVPLCGYFLTYLHITNNTEPNASREINQ